MNSLGPKYCFRSIGPLNLIFHLVLDCSVNQRWINIIPFEYHSSIYDEVFVVLDIIQITICAHEDSLTWRYHQISIFDWCHSSIIHKEILWYCYWSWSWYHAFTYIHVQHRCTPTLGTTSHTSQEAWPWNCESPKSKCPKAVPRHLQSHVVWSQVLKCSVKPYVTEPSIKCYLNEILFMRVLAHYKIK